MPGLAFLTAILCGLLMAGLSIAAAYNPPMDPRAFCFGMFVLFMLMFGTGIASAMHYGDQHHD